MNFNNDEGRFFKLFNEQGLGEQIQITNVTYLDSRFFMGTDKIDIYHVSVENPKASYWIIGNDDLTLKYNVNTSGSSDAYTNYLGTYVQNKPNLLTKGNIAPPPGYKYHAFICHAYEDKTYFVKPLANKLQYYGLKIWYDDFSLKAGDSLRRSIDYGLLNSRFGIVILSRAFFTKKWTNYELDGLVARAMDANRKVIIPVWYKIERKDVLEYSPSLADIYAITTKNKTVENVSKLIVPLLREE